ncbi:3-oxo-5-alpha-steroid 4-dehydrogenase-domain-containing protein [Coemansia spiralis]|nr:3-oxo-5-alpha-steroid 4-dehydrogenase-domain-containing protein [Coemansia spiralis]
MLILLIRFAYALLACVAVLFELVPWTREAFVKYGKTRSKPPSHSNEHVNDGVLTLFSHITVKKNHFAHFYTVGTLINALLAIDIVNWVNAPNSTEPLYTETHPLWSLLRYCIALDAEYFGDGGGIHAMFPSSFALLALSMYGLHVLVRLKESLCDQPASDARIHIGQLGVGLIFYVITPFAVIIDSCYEGSSWQPTPPWLVVIGLATYVYASLHQWRCHHILYRLRQQAISRYFDTRAGTVSNRSACGKMNRVYVIPQGDLFDYVSNPHYFCEILVYISIWSITNFQASTLLSTLIWTIINLGITSRESHRWYFKTFSTQYPHNRHALVPFIW